MLRLDINILFTILNLLIIYVLVKKFLFKPVHKILDARQAEIDKQYADARIVQENAEQLKKQYEASLESITEEKAAVLNEARGKACEEYDRIVEDAKTEASRIISDAQKNARIEEQKRMHMAKEQIADLVIEATAKLVASKQNAEADKELYNQFIAKMGEKSD